jgi:GNAT superfamily N-acetyltransferase
VEEKTRVEDLDESNIDDLIYVCSSKRLDDPIHQQGIKLKKRWLHEMLSKYGSVAKIAYHDGKPAAQILFFPEEADATKAHKRESVLFITCVYNPTPTAQKLGLGTKLLKSVINDAKHRRSCLGNRSCSFIVTKAFNTGELLPLPDFFKKNGFQQTPEGEILYFPIEGSYKDAIPTGQYEPLPEDKGKATVFYSPNCPFSYPFAKKIEGLIAEVAPHTKIELVDEWEKPQDSIRRHNWWLVVNAVPIKTFFMETEKFKEEVKRAVGRTL